MLAYMDRESRDIERGFNMPNRKGRKKGQLIMSQEEKDRTIALFLEGKKMGEIGELLGVSPTTVRDRLIRFGLLQKKKATWKFMTAEEDMTARRLYESGMSIEDVSETMGKGRNTNIRHSIRRAGGMILSPGEGRKKYTVNHNAFDELTPEARYWAGFFLADGCVIDRGIDRGHTPVIQLMLQERDIAHVEKFRTFLGTDAKISFGKQLKTQSKQRSVVLKIGSHKLAERLSQLGSVPRKSRVAKVPEFLSMCPDFWRGYVDGNGTIRWSYWIKSDGKVMYPYVSLCSGSESVLESFMSFCRSITPTKAKVKKSKTVNCFSGGLTTRNAIRVIRKLYGNATTYLDRKNAVAVEMMELYKKP